MVQNLYYRHSGQFALGRVILGTIVAAATGSLLTNPTVATPCCGVETFDWDSQTDGVGSVMSVLVRISMVDAFGGTTTCRTVFDVDNIPTCSITAPAGGTQFGVIPIDFA